LRIATNFSGSLRKCLQSFCSTLDSDPPPTLAALICTNVPSGLALTKAVAVSVPMTAGPPSAWWAVGTPGPRRVRAPPGVSYDLLIVER